MVDQRRAPRPFFRLDRRWVLSEFPADRHTLLDRRTLADIGQPALDVGKFSQIDPPPLPEGSPRVTNHVGDRVIVAGEIALLEQSEVQYTVETMHLIVEAK